MRSSVLSWKQVRLQLTAALKTDSYRYQTLHTSMAPTKEKEALCLVRQQPKFATM
jgi:hypothetical protein